MRNDSNVLNTLLHSISSSLQYSRGFPREQLQPFDDHRLRIEENGNKMLGKKKKKVREREKIIIIREQELTPWADHTVRQST